MVRYLILNTPKVLEYIQGKPVSMQTNLLSKLLEYGASNGERKNNYDPDLDELLTFVSFGEVIKEDPEDKAKKMASDLLKNYNDKQRLKETIYKAHAKEDPNKKLINVDGKTYSVDVNKLKL